MAVTRQQLRKALDLVEQATGDLVADKTFHHAVLTRLRQTEWPADLESLVKKIGKKAATTASTKRINGVTLDQRRKASLEGLVLHYAGQSPGLFPLASVQAIRNKLADHGGPKFHGPWP